MNKYFAIPAIVMSAGIAFSQELAEPHFKMGKEWVIFGGTDNSTDGKVRCYADVKSLVADDGFVKITVRIYTDRYVFVQVWGYRARGEEQRMIMTAKYNRWTGDFITSAKGNEEWQPTIPGSMADGCKKVVMEVIKYLNNKDTNTSETSSDNKMKT